MVVNERAIRCVDVMVRGEVSGSRGDGGDGGHLQGRWGVVVTEKREGGAVYYGIGCRDLPLIEGKVERH